MVEQVQENNNKLLSNLDIPFDLPLVQELVSTLMNKSLAVQENSKRNTYAPWFKELLMGLQEQGMAYNHLSDLTSIPLKTLEKFKSSVRQSLPEKKQIDTKTSMIAEFWDLAPFNAKKDLGTFWSYLGRKHPYLLISHEEVRQALINLGLRYPRGPKIKDEGVQVKKKFSPHALWEGDGKQMTITINGEVFQFCWYAFIDQDTSLLVGSSITDTESGESFLKALKEGRNEVGFYAMGVLIDNRMASADISSVQSFCKEHGITIVRTYPGNSKSNGNIESNFSVFEKFIGQVNIHGENNQEIAESMAKILAEIFTQQRNHSKRKRHGGRTPTEASNESTRPLEVKDALERMKARFEKENSKIEEKWKLVEGLQEKWPFLSNDSIEKMKIQLDKYPAYSIIVACANFSAQVAKNPDNNYGPEYLMAILRNKREEDAKRVYNEEFRAGVILWDEITLPSNVDTMNIVAEKVHDIIIEIGEKTTSSKKLLQLEALAWWMVEYSAKGSLSDLWKMLEERVQRSMRITLKTWSHTLEFIFSKIGALIYKRPPYGNSKSFSANQLISQ